MNYSVQEFAAKLKKAREKKGLSQRALGAKVGIPQSHISKMEQGVVDFQISTLIEMSRTLDLEVVLVSREHLSVVKAIQDPSWGTKSIPAYRLDDENEDD